MKVSKFIAVATLTVAIFSAAIVSAVGQDWAPVSDEKELRKLFTEYSKLKDPDSIKFQNLRHKFGKSPTGESYHIWCGTVNAKNSYGAYTGFHKFFANILGKFEPSVMVEPNGDNSTYLMYDKLMCE